MKKSEIKDGTYFKYYIPPELPKLAHRIDAIKNKLKHRNNYATRNSSGIYYRLGNDRISFQDRDNEGFSLASIVFQKDFFIKSNNIISFTVHLAGHFSDKSIDSSLHQIVLHWRDKDDVIINRANGRPCMITFDFSKGETSYVWTAQGSIYSACMHDVAEFELLNKEDKYNFMLLDNILTFIESLYQ